MKVTCELRALDPVPGSAHAGGGPAGAARTKCRGLSASEANAGAVLIEERAATLTQFLIAGLVLQSGEEADGPLVSQEVQETHDRSCIRQRPGLREVANSRHAIVSRPFPCPARYSVGVWSICSVAEA